DDLDSNFGGPSDRRLEVAAHLGGVDLRTDNRYRARDESGESFNRHADLEQLRPNRNECTVVVEWHHGRTADLGVVVTPGRQVAENLEFARAQSKAHRSSVA